MTKVEKRTFEHVLELKPGSEGEVELRFGPDHRWSFRVGLTAVDPAAGTAELVLDDWWRGYQMQHFIKDSGQWVSIWPADDGDVHAVVSFGAGKHLNISSDTALIHSLDLIDVTWRGGSLRLTFRESA